MQTLTSIQIHDTILKIINGYNILSTILQEYNKLYFNLCYFFCVRKYTILFIFNRDLPDHKDQEEKEAQRENR